MNWYRSIKIADSKSIKTMSQEVLEHYLKICLEAQSAIWKIESYFSTARINSTCRGWDTLEKYGPIVSFIIYYDDIKDNLHWVHELEKQRNNVKIEGFIQKDSNDVSRDKYDNVYPNLYKIDKNGQVVRHEYSNATRSLSFASGSASNIVYLIQHNVINRKLKPQIEFLKYRQKDWLKDVLIQTKEKNLSAPQGIKLLKQKAYANNVPPNEITSLDMWYRDWHWNQPGSENTINSIMEAVMKMEEEKQKETKQTGINPYIYYPGQNPHKEGAGKFITIEDVIAAYGKYGDFSVIARGNQARNQYSASQFAKVANDSVEMANFMMQIENEVGYLRDFYIPSKR